MVGPKTHLHLNELAEAGEKRLLISSSSKYLLRGPASGVTQGPSCCSIRYYGMVLSELLFSLGEGVCVLPKSHGWALKAGPV